MNHLSFEDDTILFTSVWAKSLKLIMQTLRTYENNFGQLINSAKSHLMVHQNVFDTTKESIKRITRFKQRQGITNYLGCPLFVGRPRISYFLPYF